MAGSNKKKLKSFFKNFTLFMHCAFIYQNLYVWCYIFVVKKLIPKIQTFMYCRPVFKGPEKVNIYFLSPGYGGRGGRCEITSLIFATLRSFPSLLILKKWQNVVKNRNLKRSPPLHQILKPSV